MEDFEDNEGLALKRADIHVEIQDMKIILDMGIIQDMEIILDMEVEHHTWYTIL